MQRILKGGGPFYLTLLACLAISGGAARAQVETIYQFTNGADGGNPIGPLTGNPAGTGKLYGVANTGGEGFGVVFQLAPPASAGGAWTESTIYTFTSADGVPNGGVKLDSDGNIYGTTSTRVFWLAPPTMASGGAWTYSVLYQFPVGSCQPNGGLVLDKNYNLYGTDAYCGTGAGPTYGQVYELSPPPEGGTPWTFQAIYNFRGIPDGQYPAGGVIFDPEGNLYGVTNQGGKGKCTDGEGFLLGCGTIFELSPSKTGWTESVLYNFALRQNNMPSWGLTFGPDEVLYGTATYAVFRLSPPASSGAAWTYQTIYQFTEGISGTIPDGPLTFDTHGNMYGTSASSGLSGYSTAFELSPAKAAGSPWTETTLANFATGFSVGAPYGGLFLGKFGDLYGAIMGSETSSPPFGSVFAIAP